ncbi:hypothetical protein [Luteimicrobium subarcticum]|uniref:Protein kinase domain-containing protein n=1 Tax=Luteimicrobium subarcticum TaxID=620910 RepID=A0A2M8WJI5_9MICO|nr:hypothetical protein [Luteimicrobium subarcticum]PJI91082.1 hypothetical protein CLV34_2346 [Luteimicrobium subarcticum]
MTDVGTRIVARYELDAPLPEDLAAVTSWRATDQVLGRTVRVVLLTGNHVAQTLDAARRTALLADPRLARVLDVGVETVPALDTQPAQEIDYVVCEPPSGTSVDELVATHGPFDAQQARAVVGEAATALEAARRRGLHHWALRPSAVRLDGSRVVVSGMGVDGPVSGLEAPDGNVGSQRDARDLVALLYFLMTGLWPTTALEDPWLSSAVARPARAPQTAQGASPLSSFASDAPADLVSLCADALGPGSSGPQTPGEVVDSLAPWHAVRPVGSRTSTASRSVPAPVVAPAAATTREPGPLRVPVFGATATAPEPPVRVSTHPAPAVAVASAPALAPGAAAGGASDAAAVPVAYGPADAEPPASFSAAARGVETAAPPTPDVRGADRHLFDPTRLVLGLFAAVVVVATVLGFVGITKAWEPAFVYADKKPAVAAPAATQGANDTGTAPQKTVKPEVRPVIAKGAQVDPPPQGDNNEHPEAVENAFDGDIDTYWYTRTYGTPQFGGLKDGVGYEITLEQAAPVSTIVLDTNDTGGHVEVRATTADKPTSGPVLAEATFAPETNLTFSKPVTAKSFVLWFDELPTTKDGKLRVELNEIQLS